MIPEDMQRVAGSAGVSPAMSAKRDKDFVERNSGYAVRARTPALQALRRG